LFLLNIPFTLDQTKALAQRVVREGPPDAKGKIIWLYRNLYGRTPTAEEIKIRMKAIHPTPTRMPQRRTVQAPGLGRLLPGVGVREQIYLCGLAFE
jgi:hypothetical protein